MLRREIHIDTLNFTIVGFASRFESRKPQWTSERSCSDSSNRFSKVFLSFSFSSPELASVSDFSRKKLLQDRLFHLNQDKAILTAKITRLNRQLSASSAGSAPSSSTRWSSFISVDQLRVVCDVLLSEMMKRNQQSQKTERELQQLAGENKELVELRWDL